MSGGVGSPERAASDTLGFVLLLGLVIVSTGVLFVAGNDAVLNARSHSETEAGEVLVQEIDAKLGSVASESGDAATTVDLAGTEGGEVSVSHDGELEILVDGGTCSSTLNLSAVRFESDSGERIAYQAGGIWRRSPSGGSVMAAPPDVTFQNRSLNVRLVDLTGQVTADRFRAIKNLSRTRNRTRTVRDSLLSGPCNRPDSITLRVTSDYHEAWASYLAEEFDTSVTSTDRTVELTLERSDLPRSVDDSKNRVVDLSDDSVVEPDSSGGRIPGADLTIDKSAGNRYFVSASTVEDGAIVSGIETFDGGTIYRRPVDVVVVMDESGSMNGQKIRDAREAAKRFVGLTNESGDRLAFVGYDTEARYVRIDGEYYFGSDHDALNDTVEGYRAGGGTVINRGLGAALDVHDVESNASRDRHVILLSDGQNSPGGGICSREGYSDADACRAEFDDRTLAGARDAARQDVVVHTIAFGSSPDEDLMEAIANETGGTYSRATTGEELTEVFRSIFTSIAESDQVVRYPVSTELTVGGTTFYPQAAGETTGVARFDDFPNVNDPSFDGEFSYATDTGDGALMDMAAVRLDCTDWERTSIEHHNDSTGETFDEVRCTEATGVEERLSATDVEIYLDGADVTHFRDAGETWWQPDVYNGTLGRYRDGGTLDLESNQALVVYDFSGTGTGGGADRLFVLYSFGLPDSTRTASVIDVTVTEVSIDG